MMDQIPSEQSHDKMKDKRRIARELLAHGLTAEQIRIQLRCSRTFVYKIRREMDLLEAE